MSLLFYNFLKMHFFITLLKNYLYVSWISRYNHNKRENTSNQLFNKAGILLTGISQETLNSFLNLRSNEQISVTRLNEFSKSFYQHPDISLEGLIKTFGLGNVQRAIEAVISYDENYNFDETIVLNNNQLTNFNLMDIYEFKYIYELSNVGKNITLIYIVLHDIILPSKDNMDMFFKNFDNSVFFHAALEFFELLEMMIMIRYYNVDDEDIELEVSKICFKLQNGIKNAENVHEKFLIVEDFILFEYLHIIAAYRGLDKVTLALIEAYSALDRDILDLIHHDFCDDMPNLNNCNKMINTVRSYDKQTPLMIAINRGYIKIALILIKSGAALDETDIYGETALNYAVRKKSYDIVNALVKAGADVNKKWYDGSDAITIAKNIGASDIVDLLVSYQYPFDFTNNILKPIDKINYINDLSYITNDHSIINKSNYINDLCLTNENVDIYDFSIINKNIYINDFIIIKGLSITGSVAGSVAGIENLL